MTSAVHKTERRIATPDTHTAMQTADDGEHCPDLLDFGVVGKVLYSGLTRFLQIQKNRIQHHSQQIYYSTIKTLIGNISINYTGKRHAGQ